jgi:Cu(I)/Ag(I) efflux system periplasmic protein CusF
LKPQLLAPVAVIAMMGLSLPASAQSGHQHHAPAATATAASASSEMASGEIRRVNQDTKKITIAHGPLKAFDMPSMTMAFGVKDPALLGKVKPGDKVKFALEKAGEDLVITRIEPAR